MTDAPVISTPRDEDLLQRDPPSERYVDPALLDARRRFRAAVARLATIPDDRLEAGWAWRAGEPGAEEGEVDLRYAFYRAYESLEAHRGAAPPADGGPAAKSLVSATEARWDLHGVLAPLDDAMLDRDPGGGEWTIRQTLAHIVNAQRAYAWFTAWWMSQRDNPDPALQIPEEVSEPFPEDADEGPGSLDEIRRRLDGIVDASAARYAGLDEATLAGRARWSGYPVEVGFRVARWSSHLREHTIQVEKTFAMLDHRPTEVDRLVRMLHAAWGRVEGTAFGAPERLSGERQAHLERAVGAIEAISDTAN